MKTGLKRSVKLGLASVLTGLIAGCATPAGQDTDTNFQNYAQKVFRHQNQTGNQLLMLIMEHPGDEHLIRAEQRLLDACRELNNIAIRKMREQATNPITKYKTRLSVDECDQTTREIRQWLKNAYLPDNGNHRPPADESE